MIEEDWKTLEHMFAFLFETFYGQMTKEFTDVQIRLLVREVKWPKQR
jgi:hypothetical protein